MRLRPALFSPRMDLVTAIAGPDAHEAGRVSKVVVDWERRGKAERQESASATIGTDTQISTDTVEDLAAVSSISAVPVSCRLNPWSSDSKAEVESAIECGADEVLLPMVRTPGEASAFLSVVDGRVDVGILVETASAVASAPELGDLPLSSVYVGLMDLAIDRGSPSIFDALVDGTVDQVREHFEIPFGVGGLTVPGGGHPILVEILAGELVRLECDFSFLRRSFIRDCGEDPSLALTAILEMLDRLERRTATEVALDRSVLTAHLVGSLVS